MAARPVTDKEVKDMIRSLAAGGSRVGADLVQRLWDENQSMREQEAVRLQLYNLEPNF